MSNNKYVVNIRGKDYLTVAGRVAMAHESGRLLGIETKILHQFPEDTSHDSEYITIVAKVKVLNEKNVDIAERLLKSVSAGDFPYGLSDTIGNLVVSTYEGVAKSPKEGSAAWQRLPANAPERSNPTEVCATSAIGRALGAAGFGDSESFASADEITVAQARQSGYEEASTETVSRPAPAQRKASSTNPPSDKQKKYIQTLAKQKLGIQNPAEFTKLVNNKFGKTIDDLTSLDVSNWIDELSKAEEPPF